MNTCNDKTHIKVLLSSLKKIYNKARVSGELEIKEIYYLNIISKILNTLELEPEEIKKLETFYMDLSYYSNNICRPEIIKSYTTTKKSFIQGTKYHCDNTPLPDYNNKDCIKLYSIGGDVDIIYVPDLTFNIKYVTCLGVTVNYNATIEVDSDRVIIIDECIKNNTLRINNELVFNYDDLIFFPTGVENIEWNIAFKMEECNK